MINEIDLTAKVHANAKLWGARVRNHAEIGDGCILGWGCYIDHHVILGINCKIQNSAQVYFPAKVGDGVFVGPGALILNDPYPRACNRDGVIKNIADWVCTAVTLEDNCSIGAGAIILPGVTVGEWAMVGAGSVVTKDVDPYTKVAGNPAKVIGMVDELST